MSFECSQCRLTFSDKYMLILHRSSHKNVNNSESRVVCQLCNSFCITVDHLKNHIQQHVQKQNYICGICRKEFVRESCYITHILKHKNTNNSCQLCSKSFSCQRNLENHLRLHTQETSYKCTRCNKPFIRKDQLISHEQIHTKSKAKRLPSIEKCHKCDYCPKQYVRKESLKLHMQSHTGHLPHRCQYCDQQFWRADHLRSHENVHKFNAATKQCLCIVCGERFLTDFLRKHMEQQHSDTMKFKCKICDKSFAKKGNLIFHESSHDRRSNVISVKFNQEL